MKKYLLLLQSFLFAFYWLAGGGSRLAHAEIVLQPHQKASVDYLTEHPDQKGLLLYHALGSGKTYVALDYAEKNPNKKVIILLPEFLKSNWTTQIESFGVKDPSRYEMIALPESEKLLKRDLKNTIVIVDEIHKLIQKIRTNTNVTSEKYINAYEKLKTAEKLLLLTGTPIFVDTSDISYIANLFDEKASYPIDPIKFRTEYMTIKPVTQLLRGQVTESKLMMVAVPFFFTLGAVVTLGTALPWAVPLFALGGSAVVPIVNETFPAGQVTFREFNADKWREFASKYVSYYNVKIAENEDYPDREMIPEKIHYNREQTHFFLSFVDEDLKLDELKIMLAEENLPYSDALLKIHSSRLQKQLLANATAGREIGNLDFPDLSDLKAAKKKAVIESPKFLAILDILRDSPGQAVVYSNYFVNGTQRFATFLDRQGMQDDYSLLLPTQPVATQMQIVDDWNHGKKRILLIHPEITEGISLIGTEQFHILEPIDNGALLEQIVGRAIRYKSHTHLPKDRRMVNVFLWEAEINYSNFSIPTQAGLIRREHWQRKYSEINPSMWSKGIVEIDPNYFLKDQTPGHPGEATFVEYRKRRGKFPVDVGEIQY